MKRFLLILAAVVTVLLLAGCNQQTCHHAFGNWKEVTPATCAVEGKLSRTCMLCSMEEITLIDKLAHTPVTDPAVEASCKEMGKTEGTHCSVCAQVLQAQQPVEKKAHTPVTDPAVAATCTTEGLTEGSHCQVCNTVLVQQETLEKRPHTPGQWIVDLAASCTTGGTRHKNCTGCGKKVAEEQTAAKGHSFGAWTTVLEATCGNIGIAKRVCACDKVEVKTITSNAHNFINGTCTVCFVSEYSQGMTFELRSDGYWVTGIGECTDTVLRFPKEHEGKKVVGIAEVAFRNPTRNRFTGVIIPEGYHTIDTMAFSSAEDLVTVQLPESLRNLGASAFSQTGIVTIHIPDGVNSIGKNLLSQCASLIYAKLPKDLTTISERMFRDCDALQEIVLPSMVTVIGKSAFEYCDALRQVILPDTLTTIEYEAFFCCPRLEFVNLPTGMTKIGAKAFYSCSKLQIPSLSIDMDKMSVGSKAFSCVTIPEVTLKGDKLTTMLAEAKIDKLTLAEGITSIEDYALERTRVRQVELPASLTAVGKDAFAHSALTSAIFKSAVDLGRGAFRSCTALKTLVLPKGTKVGAYAFVECTALETIRFGGTKQEWYAMVCMPGYSIDSKDIEMFNNVDMVFDAT